MHRELDSRQKSETESRDSVQSETGTEYNYLAALDELLLSSLVPVGGGSVLGSSYGLSGCCCCLFGSILTRNKQVCLKHCVCILINTYN